MGRMQYLLTGLAAVVILMVLSAAGGIFYGKSIEREAQSKAVADLQAAVSRLGLAIQEQAGENAAIADRAIATDKQRIDDVENIKREKRIALARLQSKLDKALADERGAEHDNPADDDNYIVVSVSEFDRVRNEARTSGSLPASKSTGIIQRGLHTVTADDISEVEKRDIAAYNACAIKYNNLWRTADTMINQLRESCAKKGPD